jgi:MFS family permease
LSKLRLRPTTAVLMLTCALYFITYVDRVNIATAAGHLRTDLHLSHTQLGFIFSAFATSYALLMIIGGWIGDKLGARMTLSISGVLWGLGTILTGLTSSFATLFGARLLVGFGESAVPSTASRALVAWTPTVKRGFAQGMTHAFGRLGNAATPPVVAALVLATSWRSAFVILGLISLGWVVIWTVYYRNDPQSHGGVTPDELEQLPVSTIKAASEYRIRWSKLVLTVLPATLASFCHGRTLWFFLNWVPLFFSTNYHMDLQGSALFSSGVFLSGTLGTVLGGTISDWHLRRTGNIRRARSWIMVFGFLSPIPFVFLLLGKHGVTETAFCLAAAMFFSEFVTGPIWAVSMDLAPRHAGTSAGIMNTGLAVAASVSPILIGWLLDLTGSWHAGFVALIVILLIGPVLTWFIRPDRPYMGEPPGGSSTAEAKVLIVGQQPA